MLNVMLFIYGKILIQNDTVGISRPFQGIFVADILLSTVTGKEMPEGT